MVVGTFFEESENATENGFIESLDLEDLEDYHYNRTIDLTSFYSSLTSQDVYHYSGSLTTPPCTESVSWFVYKEPIELTQEQLHLFTQFWAEDDEFAHGNDNNRFLQPLNGRTVYSIER